MRGKGAAALVVVLVAAAAWWSASRTTGVERPAADAAEATRAAVGYVDVEAGALEIAGDEAEANPVVGEDEPDEERLPLASGSPETDELAKAHWVEGRVRFPPGTPQDERAFVVARGRRFANGALHRSEVGPDGRFRVAFARKTGYGSLALEARYLYLTEPLRLAPRRTQEPVELKVELGARVLGRVVPTGALAGRAVDLVGETVLADVRTSSGRSSRAGRVGADLAFEICGVPAGELGVLEFRPQRALSVERPLGTIVPGGTTSVEVEVGPGARVRGRIVDPEGRAVAGASVTCSSRGDAGRGSRRMDADADGAFDLAGLPAGEATVRAVAEGYVSAEQRPGVIRDGDVGEVVIALSRGLSVAGRVLGSDGAPAAGAEVSLHAIDGRGFGARVDRADDDGRFAIHGLRASDGPFRALASLPEPSDGAAVGTDERSTRSAARRPRRVGYVDGVRPGTVDVEIALLRAEALAGRVVDDRGEALPRFSVTARHAGALGTERSREALVRETFLSPDGRFVLDGLHEGRWDVRAAAPGYRAPIEQRIDVPASGTLELRLVRSARVRGVVVDARGQPVAGAKVVLSSTPGDAALQPDSDSATSDAKGRFALEAAPGAISVRANAQGLSPSSPFELALAAGDTRSDLVLRVPDGGRIAGHVLDGEGNPADGWEVVLTDERGRSAGFERTNADGSFLSEPLSPGAYAVVLGRQEGRRSVGRSRVDAVVGENETVEVRLGGRSEGATRLHGTIRCGGTPLAGLAVTVRSEESVWARATTRTDDGGRYELELLPGRHTLSIYRDADGGLGGISLGVDVAVAGEPELRRDVDLPSGSISGRVVDGDGRTLEHASLSAQAERGGKSFTVSAEIAPDGTFSFDCLPPGRYRLSGDAWGERSYASIVRNGVVVGEGARVEGLELHARPACSVNGIVRDPAGASLVGVRVFARAESGELAADPAHCDAAGRFSMRALQPGRTTFLARGGSRASSESAPVELTPDRRADVELVLGPGTALRVDVVGGGAPCFVRVVDAAGREVACGGSQERPLAVLPPGDYRVVGTDEVGATAEASASLDGHAEATVSLRFDR